MKNKNKFLEKYTEIPDKQTVRKFIFAISIIVNLVNYCVLIAYHDFVLFSPIQDSILNTLCVSIVIVFDIFSIILYIFPSRMYKLTYLYTAIAFTGSSIFYFFISSLVFIHELEALISYLVIGISLLIYLLIIMAVIYNIKCKIKNGVLKTANKTFSGVICALCISIGIILSKQIELRSMPFAIILLIVSYALIPTVSGFHKFYLVIKNKNK